MMQFFLSRTTQELEEILPECEISPENQRVFLEIAAKHDRALYAGIPQGTQDADKWVQQVRGIILAEKNRRKEAVKV
jgi:hypothetical protein